MDAHRWPRDPTEEDLERLRPGMAELGRMLGPAVVEEVRRVGELPSPERLAAVVARVFETDPWLAELCENRIDAEDALYVAEAMREESLKQMGGDG